MRALDIYNKLEKYFKPEQCTDVVKNGIQYHNAEEIEKVYTATFASESVISEILMRGQKNVLLFTHHPLPQRKPPDYGPSEISRRLIMEMKENKVSLFSYHIPLDRNGVYSPGNNLAKAMGIIPYDEFYFQNNVFMGVLCNSHFATVYEAKERLEQAIDHKAKLYCYGDSYLNDGRIAIMAGGASNLDIYEYLADKGVNTFITGVTNPKKAEWIAEIHEKAKENGINLIGGTHCSTEKFACIAMLDFFRGMGLESEFIDEEPDFCDL
ncbi:Nif3-like dinuclear metal center hexameric protein [Lutispora thermophila]|uniref:GTP cyclohydrolase 1 type 2 homolog n=1 Tax=Lutispora thermophila DSM 19022 TaxID=1122184 RepID=A0A1M6EDW2_9FIRM|nr:Nif3-like dinuclear metal center hexameric protein [Lutispora thermophila]SHI83654.1 Putative GTP cyclohydrolase 1 type 2, NIF3 family [Lutispora thermophila DSM 19022]